MTKTLSITDAAYARLASEKRPGESFTDVIMRLTQKRRLSELHKLLPKRETQALAEAYFDMRNERVARREKRLREQDSLFRSNE